MIDVRGLRGMEGVGGMRWIGWVGLGLHGSGAEPSTVQGAVPTRRSAAAVAPWTYRSGQEQAQE
jgi:hypothetical protein